MRRIGIIGVSMLCLFAEPSRDAYRAAYRAWREADPNLERDASTMPADLAARAKAVAAHAAKFGAERSAFLHQTAADEQQSLARIESHVADLPDLAQGVRDTVASEVAVVQRNLNTFANDTDPGIRQLKAALDRENLALGALSNAIADRQSAADTARSATAKVEEARAKAASAGQAVMNAVKAGADQADREAAAWADYYAKLGGAAAVETSAVPSPAPVPVPVTPRTGPTPLPLVRYIGEWTFPNAGVYHGPQPESVDLVVNEDRGHVTGTFSGRFKLAAGSKDDPVVRFDFSGDLQTTANQVFSLVTSDGAKGTIELIPGSAFNLLEVNFQIEAKPGKIGQGNVVLLKK